MPIEPVTITAHIDGPGYRVEVADGMHDWCTDEPASTGGTDEAPTPMRQMWGALGSCVATTLAMYANTKGMPLSRVDVEVGVSEGRNDAGAPIAEVSVAVRVEGEGLDDAMRARLTQVAARCPVHRILEQGVRFTSETVTFA